MGYYSDVVIAVDKETFNTHRLLKTVPHIMIHDVPPTEYEGAYYWKFISNKWYDHFEEVNQVNAFLAELESVPDVEFLPKWRRESPNPEPLKRGCYGFVRVGEEFGDVETHGSPEDYEIDPVQSIECPI